MKVLNKKMVFGCLLLSLCAAMAGYVYFFDSMFKGDYYFRVATSLDEENPNGSGEALKYYRKALEVYKGIGDVGSVVETYIHLALLQYKFGNAVQVEKMILEALAIGKDKIPSGMESRVYLLLASTLEPEKAREYIRSSLKISEEKQLHVLTAEAYYLLGQGYEYKAEFGDAIHNYKKSVEALGRMTSIDVSFDAGAVYERLAEVYAGGGEVDEAIKYYLEALEYRMHTERGFVTANYMKIIGDLYDEKNNMDLACGMWSQSQEEYAFFGIVTPFKVSDRAARVCSAAGYRSFASVDVKGGTR